MGRPTKFTQALAEKICERIADRESLRSICRDEDMPAKSTVLSWLADDGKAAFRARYALAREILADSFVDELVEIADDRSDDWIEKKNAAGETTGWQENGEAIRRSQLRIATRQWVAEKLKPKKYGSKIEPEQGVTGEVSQLLEDINGKTRGLPNGG
ncbi:MULTISPECIES: terminase small subunit protein [unclassified Rhizobium]|uniref:terminase small subunit-like protein n=1 Tax=unclassified Rhizobium TaxID=2613769 RepID=UPI001C82D882|nr:MULTISPECIES: terminase small subunit protein [unclassified Rhizobium]MBX5165210.1 terminase small subunit protein [Rhizobium sp. NZLR4b]MBX5172790.1 terminase small subunit protein [Rhizobium sp. NZLR1b]MBX5185123.1 terminase small subunit protein [Rhizobium sp. NZLR5]MBX5197671.1 terminase small subunit protein [Rhizobium sp. NZLR10]MBX5208920.1 terminase small subunit protein [Rhizobium sp. NZLR11]